MNEQEQRVEELCRRLESGTIQQTTGQLAYEDARCCLGVACDIAVEAGVIEVGKNQNRVTYGGEAFYMPYEVKMFFGFTDSVGRFFDKGYSMASLSGLNDDGISFREIAAVIRKRPKGLFIDG